jgi:hypothetical protein
LSASSIGAIQKHVRIVHMKVFPTNKPASSWGLMLRDGVAIRHYL